MSDDAEPLDPGVFGPLQRGGVRDDGHDRLWRVVRWGVAFIAVLALTVVATVGGLLVVGSESIEQISVPGLRPAPAAAGEPPPVTGQAGGIAHAAEPGLEEVKGVTTILLVGSDSRAGLSEEQLLRLGTESDEGSVDLTDTVMLVQLDADAQRAALLSFPRDLLVARCDGTQGRINSAYQVGEQQREGGGPACLVETVTTLSGIEIDHYIEVDMAGFIHAVDAVGGVTFHVDQPIKEPYAGLDIQPGCVTFNGERALAFVRTRMLDNDFGRIARQQRFVKELVDKATSLEVLANPQRVLQLVRAVGGAIRTDRGLSTLDLARLAYTFRSLPAAALETRVVPASDTEWGSAMVLALDPEAEELFAAFRRGSLAPPPTPQPLPDDLPAPADVPPLVVRNGAGIEGLATAAGDALRERGFNVARVDDAESFDFTRTQVVYPPQARAAAQTLAASIGGARLVAAEEGSELAVVLGSDFSVDALPPPPAPAGEPAPEPPPAPAEPAPVLPQPDPDGYVHEYTGSEVSPIEC